MLKQIDIGIRKFISRHTGRTKHTNTFTQVTNEWFNKECNNTDNVLITAIYNNEVIDYKESIMYILDTSIVFDKLLLTNGDTVFINLRNNLSKFSSVTNLYYSISRNTPTILNIVIDLKNSKGISFYNLYSLDINDIRSITELTAILNMIYASVKVATHHDLTVIDDNYFSALDKQKTK